MTRATRCRPRTCSSRWVGGADCEAPPACDATADCHAADLPKPAHGKWRVSDDCQTAHLVCETAYTQISHHGAPRPPPSNPFGAPPPPPPPVITTVATCRGTGTAAGGGSTNPFAPPPMPANMVFAWGVPQCCGQCRADQDYCSSSPCHHGSSCTDDNVTRVYTAPLVYTVERSYTCACVAGYNGDTCAHIDECASAPCQNGGLCHDSSSNFKTDRAIAPDAFACTCFGDFEGNLCEL